MTDGHSAVASPFVADLGVRYINNKFGLKLTWLQ
jgi:hypothetical protein